MPVGILGLGSYIPPKLISNDEIAEWSGVSPERITDRTGIGRRYYADSTAATSDLAYQAARCALAAAPKSKEELRALIVATSTPDQPQPATAAIVQEKLSLSGPAAFDVNAVCSGFLYALGAARGLLSGPGAGDSALVIGADIYSRQMDRADYRTVSLFGDGAGAAVLGEVPEGYGIKSHTLRSYGEYRNYVEVVAGGTREVADDAARAVGRHYFRMKGRQVRDLVLDELPKLVSNVVRDAGLGMDEIDRFFFHQANTKMVLDLARLADVDLDRVPLTAPELGNLAAASIPVTMHRDHQRKPFRRGENFLLAAAGGGISMGTAVLTWY